MKKHLKNVMVLLMTLVMALSVSITAFAMSDTKSQDGLKVTLSTDKDEYAKGEKVVLTLTVENVSDKIINNAAISYDIPENVKDILSEDSKLPTTISEIKAGEKLVFPGEGVIANDDKSVDGNEPTGDTTSIMLYVVLIVISVAAIALLAIFRKKMKRTVSLMLCVVMFAGLTNGIGSLTSVFAATETKATIEVSVSPKIDGKTEIIKATVKFDKTSTSGTGEEGGNKDSNITTGNTSKTVSVHDPSIIKDEKTGRYYIFGSHMAWAYSDDLITWTTFTNNINKDYKTLFAKEFEWAKMGDSVYDPSGNMWAPDVIYNKDLGKWCMYMSINGYSWNSSIAMLTSDSLDGKWEYEGTVVYSGFTNADEHHDFAKTDYTEVTGDTTLSKRYISDKYPCKDGKTPTETTTWNFRYGAHAIDPCVFYGEDGKLYMSYGSWSGGIYIIELDENTGLRDTKIKYEDKDGQDPYMGINLSGGSHASGEGPYIQYIDGYYYMFISYGGLIAKEGYSMRVFRSKKPTGPYVDETSDDARKAISSGAGNINGTVGIKLMTYYKWNTMEKAQVAQGHNSVLVDEDGRAYVVFHTRTNDGSEGHYVKVHQLFTNEDGWLVAAPYAYDGEKISETGYKKEDVTGKYGVLFHKTVIDNTSLEYVKEQAIELKADGTITGDYTGTWSMKDGKPYVDLTLGGKTYKGVLVKQNIEGTKDETKDETMCFTVLGTTDEVCVWGSKYAEGENAVDKAIEEFNFVEGTVSDLSLPATGNSGVGITWKSDNAAIITNDGKVTLPADDTVVNMIATFESGNDSKEMTYPVTVYGKNNLEGTSAYKVGKTYFETEVTLAAARAEKLYVRNPFNNSVTNGLQINNGVTVKFDVEISKLDVLGPILAFNQNTAGDGGKLYFTGGSYLGFNPQVDKKYFDANLSNFELVEDYIKSGKKTVELKFTPKGFEVSVDGVTAYTSEDIFASAATGAKILENYFDVIRWLNNDAKVVNIGSGAWTDWADRLTEGKISNLEFWVDPIEKEDTAGYAYYEGFALAETTGWTSTNAFDRLSICNDGDKRGNYIKFAPTGNSRGAMAEFVPSSTFNDKYTVELDVKLTAGSNQETQFAITGKDRVMTTSTTMNDGLDSGYILKLSSTNSTTWSVSGSVSGSANTVIIPKDTWVSIKAEVDKVAKTAKINILNGTTSLYSETVNISGTGELDGLYIRGGRYNPVICVDSIKVKNN